VFSKIHGLGCFTWLGGCDVRSRSVEFGRREEREESLEDEREIRVIPLGDTGKNVLYDIVWE